MFLLEKIYDVSGYWNTNIKELVLFQYGNNVVGRYNHFLGVIDGILEGNILTGIWFQSESNGDCNYGPFRLVFNGEKFTGIWGYCDTLENRPWNGIKTKDV